jgi:hypothetical protein
MRSATEEIMFQMLLAQGGNTLETKQEESLSKRKMINNIVRLDLNKARAKSWVKKNLQK